MLQKKLNNRNIGTITRIDFQNEYLARQYISDNVLKGFSLISQLFLDSNVITCIKNFINCINFLIEHL